jgi:hypothetical protein
VRKLLGTDPVGLTCWIDHVQLMVKPKDQPGPYSIYRECSLDPFEDRPYEAS